MGSVLNVITAINRNNVASNKQLLVIVIVLCVYEKDRKRGWGGWEGKGMATVFLPGTNMDHSC